jgi:putative radical SAM enzyme (TIGR03279 family)
MPDGIVIASAEPASDLARAGLTAGDCLIAIDGLVPRDIIDVQLELPGARRLVLRRGNEIRELDLPEGAAEANALTFAEPMPGGIRECNNHCEFCFIRGLPRGLRPSLYVFDDDHRYSFQWGNFLTLTNLQESDWARIGYQRLSPLNVSVHATDPEVRGRLLNNRHAPPILPQLERLASLGIRVNAQVVLCSGMNDGACLEQTVSDLSSLYPTVQSLSVVPVGLTRFSRVKNIRRPTPAEADRAVAQCEAWQAQLRPRLGVGFVYPSDELYLLAGREDMPDAQTYDGFPVLSNGVGMLRSMLDEWQRVLARHRGAWPPARRVAWLAGQLAAPALGRMAQLWQGHAGWQPTVVAVDSAFFGEQVTVSGLLTGQDLIDALRQLPEDVEDIVLPRGPFGFDGQHTLDGISAETVGAAHPGSVHLASTPAELADLLFTAAGRRPARTDRPLPAAWSSRPDPAATRLPGAPRRRLRTS